MPRVCCCFITWTTKRPGQTLLLNGRMLTGRDAAHKRIVDMLARYRPNCEVMLAETGMFGIALAEGLKGSRAIANELSKTIGQPVTVENKPGAGGNLGGADAARAAPDGYTIFMTTSGIQAINPVLYTKMPFDPNKDLQDAIDLLKASKSPC